MAAFYLFVLSISSLLLSSPSAFPIPPRIPQPFIDSPPLPLPEQNPQISATPGLAPAASPIAAPVGSANHPAGQQQQQASGGLEQDQQQQLDASVNRGNGQAQGPEQGNLQLGADVGVQPIGVEQGQGQLQPSSAGVQPTGFWQGLQQQALGFGAQPLVDNTPFDSGSSRMERSLFGYGLALLWFMVWAEALACF